MEQQTLLTADYLDILFDHRNKAYGGYELRKNYDKRVRAALFIMLVSAGSLTAYALLQPVQKIVTASLYHPPIELTDIPHTIIPPAPPVVVQPPAKTGAATVNNTIPKIVADIKPEDDLMPSVDKLNTAISSTATKDGTAPTGNEGTSNAKSGTGPAIITPPAAMESSAPLVWVSEMPQFSGKLDNYLNNNLRYPAMARENNIEGKVILRFVVNEDGAISNVDILKGIGGGCNEEAVRVVKSMPRWKPGKQNGRAVKVLLTLPITFQLM